MHPGSCSSLTLVLLVGIPALACQEGGEPSTAGDMSSTGTSSDTTSGDSDSTSSDTTSGDSDSTGSDPTGGEQCSIDECIERQTWEWQWTPHYCVNLVWKCGFPAPCEQVYLTLSDTDNEVVVDTVDAAICVITAMRDGVPAHFELNFWGNLVDVINVGDGTGMVQWSHSYGDLYCAVRSQRLALQPASYFSDCLSDPTPSGLAACLGTTYDCESDVLVPPWATGACTGDVPDLCSWNP